MRKAAIPYIVLAIMVGATLCLHVIDSDKIIQEIAFSSIILYLCILILTLRKKNSSKQHDSRIRILLVFVLGINFFISIFSGNERFKILFWDVHFSLSPYLRSCIWQGRINQQNIKDLLIQDCTLELPVCQFRPGSLASIQKWELPS